MDKVKILVVDDESRMRKLVRDFLTRQNYEVLEAADGEEALDIFYKDKAIALLILDVMMPKMNGWEVCREIRQTSKVPIIMLTAKSDESDELMGFDLGVDEYITKPFSPKILVARVEAILRRAPYSRWPAPSHCSGCERTSVYPFGSPFLFFPCGGTYFTAMHSISSGASLGSLPTCTALRAG